MQPSRGLSGRLNHCIQPSVHKMAAPRGVAPAATTPALPPISDHSSLEDVDAFLRHWRVAAAEDELNLSGFQTYNGFKLLHVGQDSLLTRLKLDNPTRKDSELEDLAEILFNSLHRKQGAQPVPGAASLASDFTVKCFEEIPASSARSTDTQSVEAKYDRPAHHLGFVYTLTALGGGFEANQSDFGTRASATIFSYLQERMNRTLGPFAVNPSGRNRPKAAAARNVGDDGDDADSDGADSDDDGAAIKTRSSRKLTYSSAIAQQLQKLTEINIMHQVPLAGGGIADMLWYPSDVDDRISHAIMEVGFDTFRSKQQHLLAYVVNVFRMAGFSQETAMQMMKDGWNPCILGLYLQLDCNSILSKWHLRGYCIVADVMRELRQVCLRVCDVALAHGSVTTAADLKKPFAALSMCVAKRGWPHSPWARDRAVDSIIDQRSSSVFKVFSGNTERAPNSHLYSDKLGATTTTSKIGTKHVVLRYNFIEGKHQPKTVQQARDVLAELIVLHGKGYCHGDVRGSNIVFGATSHLIDLDYAKMTAGEFARYPIGYVFDGLPDVMRHPEAREGLEMKTTHDVLALYSILSRYECLESPGIWAAAVSLLAAATADTSALAACHAALEPISKHALHLKDGERVGAKVPFLGVNDSNRLGMEWGGIGSPLQRGTKRKDPE
eukprot:m.75759 g.75759  ORF g.75759 m.75759 type:complete len:667 (-) comp7835_c0_seq1:38-2038(-)